MVYLPWAGERMNDRDCVELPAAGAFLCAQDERRMAGEVIVGDASE